MMVPNEGGDSLMIGRMPTLHRFLIAVPLAVVALGCASPAVRFKVVDGPTGQPIAGAEVVRGRYSRGVLGMPYAGTWDNLPMPATDTSGLTETIPLKAGDVYTISHSGHATVTLQAGETTMSVVRPVVDASENVVHSLLKAPRYEVVRSVPLRRGEAVTVWLPMANAAGN